MNIDKREAADENSKTGGILGTIEKLGNKLPDPAVLFIFAMLLTWVVSWLLGGYEFELPKKGGSETQQVANQLTGNRLLPSQIYIDQCRFIILCFDLVQRACQDQRDTAHHIAFARVGVIDKG